MNCSWQFLTLSCVTDPVDMARRRKARASFFGTHCHYERWQAESLDQIFQILLADGLIHQSGAAAQTLTLLVLYRMISLTAW